MAKSKAIGKFKSSFKYDILKIDELASLIDDAYAYLDRDDYIFDDNESPLYNRVANGIDELIEDMERLHTYLVGAGIDRDEGKYASTKKSKRDDINKRLAKLGGFTKEDDEKKIPIEDDDAVEIEEEDGKKVVEIESEETHDKEVEDGEESDSDNLNACSNKDKKARKSMITTNKKRMKMKKGEDMPEDADDQQDQNEKGSGNAGSTLPEDADDQQDQNEAGSGSAGSDLPEDADDQQDIKESARKARLARMQKERNKSARKSVPPVRKFSMTPGGQPNQESYNQRYSQAPMVREAISRHFGDDNTNKSFDERQMMQDRIDNLMKSHRNPTGNNGVPKKLR